MASGLVLFRYSVARIAWARDWPGLLSKQDILLYLLSGECTRFERLYLCLALYFDLYNAENPVQKGPKLRKLRSF